MPCGTMLCMALLNVIMLSTLIFNVILLSVTSKRCYAECHFIKCPGFAVMLSFVALNVIMPSVMIFFVMLGVVMLIVL